MQILVRYLISDRQGSAIDPLKKRSNGGGRIDSYEAEAAFTYKLSEGKLASKGICFVS
ncbi:hypothetical protein [Paenibacillus azoreducens]|uniref:hypothetical protein n=1 Tax=Paenibacillus azoreducens TaxID=116718 RepID=UPI001BB43F4B|nr:hypothetical protein [Paenibacillus azoreducens]